MRDIDKIQRQVHFMYANIFDPEDTSGKNNKWNYNRAPEGYKFQLVASHSSVAQINSYYTGLLAFYDGHEYTHWNQYPGVESRELIGRGETNLYQYSINIDFHGWECKEYTIGIRSLSTTNPYKIVTIVYYYLVQMSRLETYYYAVIQPKWNRFKKAFRTTLDPKDE